jgi:16S rRNA G966 N2-methylase RsmD
MKKAADDRNPISLEPLNRGPNFCLEVDSHWRGASIYQEVIEELTPQEKEAFYQMAKVDMLRRGDIRE